MAERCRRNPCASLYHSLSDAGRLAMWRELFRPVFLADLPPTPRIAVSEEQSLINQAARTFQTPADRIAPQI
eukprot:2748269-Alexandrium_andersonii.AAC.1